MNYVVIFLILTTPERKSWTLRSTARLAKRRTTPHSQPTAMFCPLHRPHPRNRAPSCVNWNRAVDPVWCRKPTRRPRLSTARPLTSSLQRRKTSSRRRTYRFCTATGVVPAADEQGRRCRIRRDERELLWSQVSQRLLETRAGVYCCQEAGGGDGCLQACDRARGWECQ